MSIRERHLRRFPMFRTTKAAAAVAAVGATLLLLQTPDTLAQPASSGQIIVQKDRYAGSAVWLIGEHDGSGSLIPIRDSRTGQVRVAVLTCAHLVGKGWDGNGTSLIILYRPNDGMPATVIPVKPLALPDGSPAIDAGNDIAVLTPTSPTALDHLVYAPPLETEPVDVWDSVFVVYNSGDDGGYGFTHARGEIANTYRLVQTTTDSPYHPVLQVAVVPALDDSASGAFVGRVIDNGISAGDAETCGMVGGRDRISNRIFVIPADTIRKKLGAGGSIGGGSASGSQPAAPFTIQGWNILLPSFVHGGGQ